jgi:hypothetical protein
MSREKTIFLESRKWYTWIEPLKLDARKKRWKGFSSLESIHRKPLHEKYVKHTHHSAGLAMGPIP